MIHPDSAALIVADAKISFEEDYKESRCEFRCCNPFPFGTPEYDLWEKSYNEFSEDCADNGGFSF